MNNYEYSEYYEYYVIINIMEWYEMSWEYYEILIIIIKYYFKILRNCYFYWMRKL